MRLEIGQFIQFAYNISSLIQFRPLAIIYTELSSSSKPEKLAAYHTLMFRRAFICPAEFIALFASSHDKSNCRRFFSRVLG